MNTERAIGAAQRPIGYPIPTQARLEELWSKFVITSHHPKPGVAFVDPGPVFADESARREIQAYLESMIDHGTYNKIIGIAVRGAGIAQSMADTNKKGLIIARKPDEKGEAKMTPGHEVYVRTKNEYDSPDLVFDGTLISPGDEVIVVDDIAASGGTASGFIKVLEELGAKVVAVMTWTVLDYLEPKIVRVEEINGERQETPVPVYAVFHQRTKPILPEDTSVKMRLQCPL